jgi:mRNA-decapping enzyme subunit 2
MVIGDKFVCICSKCTFTRKNVDTGEDSDFGPYIHNLPRAGTFVHTADKLVLMVQSYNGKWGPPKGRIEDGETHLQCALRETYEETGLDVSPYVRVYKLLNNKWNMYDVLLTEKVNVDPQSSEITGIGWFTVDCLLHNKNILNHPAKLCMYEYMGIRC